MRLEQHQALTGGASDPFASGEAGDGYRRLFSALPLPALLIDAAAFVRLANRQGAEFLGLSPTAALQRRSILQFLPVEDRQRLVWRLSDRAGQEVFEIRSLTMRLDSGPQVPCDVHLTHLEGWATREPMSMMVIVDRSLEAELRQSERQLRQQGQRLSDVIWASQSGTWDWDVSSGRVSVNERFAEVVGAALTDIEPLSDRSLLALVHPEDRAQVDALRLRRNTMAERSFDQRLRLAHRGGGWIWVLNRGRVLEWDDHDRPLRLAGTVLDISREVESEQSLRGAKEQAEASERLKSEWLANVSHEVRTPLNSVLGLLQLMQEWPGDDRQREALGRAVESANLLRLTLDDLLDNAKLEAGQMGLEQVPLDLSELASSVMAMFSHRAQDAGLHLSVHLAPHTPAGLRGDPLRLRQVINNFVSNALKFTVAGRVTVDIGGHQPALGGAYELRVDVRDTGMGIAPEFLPQLFKAYYQADASTTRHHGGTGLGLSISRRLVELMGGRIGVNSQRDRGSHFWFTVPLEVDEQDTPEGEADPADAQDRYWSSDGIDAAPQAATAAGTSRAGSDNVANLWAGLQRSLVLQEHASLELCQALMQRVQGPQSALLLRVLRHARNFNFEAALGELKAGPDSPL